MGEKTSVWNSAHEASVGRTKPHRRWMLSKSGGRELKAKLGATVIKTATRIGGKLEF